MQDPTNSLIVYYIVYVMQGAGIDNPLLPASIQYIINVLMTVPAIIWMDKWGRRPTLLLGSFAMMSLLLISGSIQGAFGHPVTDPRSAVTWAMSNDGNRSNAVVACSYLFVATFAISWGPVSWTMPAEVFPNKVRAMAVSLSTASNWAWNCVLAFAVPPLLRTINWKMYMIFAAFNGVAFIHMFFTAPETKGITLEEMDDVFDVRSFVNLFPSIGLSANLLPQTEWSPTLENPLPRVAPGQPSEGHCGWNRQGRHRSCDWPPHRDPPNHLEGVVFFLTRMSTMQGKISCSLLDISPLSDIN